MTFHLEVSDDYVTEIDVEDEKEAKRVAERVAVTHGGHVGVWLYPGPIKSGVQPIGYFQ